MEHHALIPRPERVGSMVAKDNPDIRNLNGPALDAAVAEADRRLSVWFAGLSPEKQAEVEARFAPSNWHYVAG